MQISRFSLLEQAQLKQKEYQTQKIAKPKQSGKRESNKHDKHADSATFKICTAEQCIENNEHKLGVPTGDCDAPPKYLVSAPWSEGNTVKSQDRCT